MMKRLFNRRRPRRFAFAAALLASTALAGGGFAWSAANAATSPAQAPLELPPVVNQAGFAAVVAKVKPAVVNIATSEMAQPAEMQQTPQMPSFPQGSPFGNMFKQFFDHQGQGTAMPEHALGSGFIIDPAGYIVTNNHVVDGATKVMVTIEDGSSYPAKIVGRDPKTDLAVLKIDAGKPLPYVAFGNSDSEQVGDWVVAVGNPYGLGGTVTAGIVSAHDRNINEGPYDDFLQIDAPINPGNSGGPLFNQSGQVVGIDTAIYSPNGGSVGIGFAIPSNVAEHIVTQLREHGSVERGWLGVSMQPLTEPLAKAVGLSKTEGVLVDQIETNSPAAQAKLQQGDVITAYDGKPIANARDFAMAVADTQPGRGAKLTVWRDGGEHTIDVTIAKQSATQTAEAGSAPSDEAPVGMALAPLNADTRSEMGLAPDSKGVVVANVTPDSRADESGVQAGDVILKVGNDTVTSPAQVATRIHDAEHAKKQAVPLLVSRNGTTYYLALQLAQG
jgi:serine protease Do